MATRAKKKNTNTNTTTKTRAIARRMSDSSASKKYMKTTSRSISINPQTQIKRTSRIKKRRTKSERDTQSALKVLSSNGKVMSRRKVHPLTPHHPPAKETGARMKSIAVLSSLKDVITQRLNHTMEDPNLRYELGALLPVLKNEIMTIEVPHHPAAQSPNNFKTWRNFCYAYTRYMGNVSKACVYVGINRNCYYRARDKYQTLNLILSILDDRYLDDVEETMKRHALLPNSVVERFFILKTQRKAKYGEKEQGDIAVKIELNYPNIAGMRDTPKDIEAKVIEEANVQA